MTNIIAAVTVAIVTNVTEIHPTKNIPAPCPDQQGFAWGCTVAHWQTVPDPDAKSKTVNTKCVEKTTLAFSWNGAREVVTERVLWESNQVFKLEWAPK